MRVYALFAALALSLSAQTWKPAPGPLLTQWAAKVDPKSPLPEYPRPQLVRSRWQNLNGLWDFAVTPKDAPQPASFSERILVPFAAESSLSGIGRAISDSDRVWYRRTFSTPSDWSGQRLLLHFGAVDWHAVVSVNDRIVGEHRGGYVPFTFDITDALRPGVSQELVVSVWDPTDAYTQPRGKQIRKPEGIWYTSVTGIWQTVWLEPVPAASIRRLRPVPDLKSGKLTLHATTDGAGPGVTLRAEAIEGGRSIASAAAPVGKPLTLSIPNPKPWSPESPFLYDLKVSLWNGSTRLDEATSYFALRDIALGPDAHGHTRILLNGKPYFQMGPLDQGWWPDGLYTAPTDEALRWDIELTRNYGFNMARKHVKVEPARWYYHADRLGLLVWQDMPNGSLHRGVPGSLRINPGEPDAVRDPGSSALFEAELLEMIDALAAFPSIVTWVPFNEGWGQYDTARVADMVKRADPSRLVNATSGWTDRGVGDMFDSHTYPGPGMEPPEARRATVNGEYGGLGLVVPDHLWMKDRNWGYQSFDAKEELVRQYEHLANALHGMIGQGLSAAIYTQTTDVEVEVNGLVTYDRAVAKFPPGKLKAIHQSLYNETRKARVLLPDSSFAPQQWKFTTTEPAATWNTAAFDDKSWQSGPGGFGKDEGVRFRSGTPWTGPAIWTRREFTADSTANQLYLTMFQGVTECDVYLNGQLLYSVRNPRIERRHYTHIDVSDKAGLLKKGANVLAIRATRDKGARAVDAGLYTLIP